MSESSSSISLDPAKVASSNKQLRFRVPMLPLSSKNSQRNEEVAMIKKLYYNPFNEAVLYKEFKQYQDQQNKVEIENAENNQKIQTYNSRTNSAQEILPKSLVMLRQTSVESPTQDESIWRQQNMQPQQQQMILTDRPTKPGFILLNQRTSEKINTNREHLGSRKSSFAIEDFKQFNEGRQGFLNSNVMSTILPTKNEEYFCKQQYTNIDKIRRHSSNNMINNFFNEDKQQTPRVYIKDPNGNQQDKQKKVIKVHKSKALSLVEPIPIKEQQDIEFKEQVKRKSEQETVAYSQIKGLNKVLKRQRVQTARFLNKTKQKQEDIEHIMKEDVVIELDTKANQEKQLIQYIIREQLNPSRPQEEIHKMFVETLHSNRIKNFMDKLKIEKATQVANKILTKIKTFSGKTYLRNKFFSDLQKDPQSLAQPLTVIVEYNNLQGNDDGNDLNSNRLSPKQVKKYFEKRKKQQLSLSDPLEIDFFKHINPELLARNKADTFYEIRSKAMNLNKLQTQRLSNPLLNSARSRVQFESTSPTSGNSTPKNPINKLSTFRNSLQQNFQNNADGTPKDSNNLQIQYFLDDAILLKQTTQSNEFTPSSASEDVVKKIIPKRKPLLNGGIEYEYVNELGFKVRVQQPPKKKQYKEVTIEKIKKAEDVFFSNFVSKANKIANEVEVRNRISDHTHKQVISNFKRVN